MMIMISMLRTASGPAALSAFSTFSVKWIKLRLEYQHRLDYTILHRPMDEVEETNVMDERRTAQAAALIRKWAGLAHYGVRARHEVKE